MAPSSAITTCRQTRAGLQPPLALPALLRDCVVHVHTCEDRVRLVARRMLTLGQAPCSLTAAMHAAARPSRASESLAIVVEDKDAYGT